MFERFSQDARQVVVSAQEQARGLGHNYIGTEHLLLGVLAQPPEVPAARALRTLGYSLDGVRAGVEQIVGPGDRQRSRFGHIPFTARAKKVMELSLREALRLEHDHIGSEHIVLAIVREGGGVAAQVLIQHGPSLEDVRKAVLAVTAEPGLSTRGPGTPAGARTPAADAVLALAQRLAAGAPVGSHHLLEALARTDGSMGGQVLAALGVDAEAVVGTADGLDVTSTSDVTAEQVAAGRIRLWVEGEEVRLAVADPALAARARELVAVGGGELRGEGPLVGPFIGLHRGVVDGLDAVAVLVAPDDGEPAPARTSLRDRLRRRSGR
jgi:ATP-dependent Clp protease ATP-binding subunit ClpC